MADSITGLGRTIGASFIRPNDTTAYTAGDVMGDGANIIFPAVGINAQGFAIIQSAMVVIEGNNALEPDLELWLFSAPPAVVADNAAFAPTDAEMRTLVTVIAFPVTNFKVGLSGSGAAGNVVCEANQIGKPINAINLSGATGGTTFSGGTLYGQMVVRNAYTPIAVERSNVFLNLID